MIYTTGCSGYIGKLFLSELQKLGIKSIGLSRTKSCSKTFSLHECREINLLTTTPEESLFEVPNGVLVHLAWVATPGLFWHSTENSAWYTKSKELIDAFFKAGGKKIINIGSCAEYSDLTLSKITETDAIGGNTLYGANKSALSKYIETMHTSNFTNLRVFNLYGLSEKSGRIIPDCIDKLRRGERFFLNEPKQIRDFIYIGDLIKILITTIENNAVGHLNLGTGMGMSIESVVELIEEKLGIFGKVDKSKDYPRPSMVVASTTKFEETFPNFELTGIDDGLSETIFERGN